MVTEQELFDLLKEHHWSKQISLMEGGKKAYRAKRRVAGKLASRYIGTERGLQDMTPDDVLEKLNRPTTNRPSTDEKAPE